jgi:S1-C subfamily serine protease
MPPAPTLAVLLLLSGITSGQTTGTLRVTVTLPDAAQTPVPIAGHALLISDNPPTRTPRRVVSAANGTIVVNLAPGKYVVESDRSLVFLGKAYQWTIVADVLAGVETTLALTAQNAEVVVATDAAPDTDAPRADPDRASLLGKWRASLVTVWSPTSRASGFVVDARGLIATDRNAVGRATSVEVQLSPTLKVPGRVLSAEPTQSVAIVWVDPSVLTQASPLPIACPPPAASLNDGDEIVALTTSPRATGDVVPGEITGFHPRGIETDMRLAFGEAGGPVFSGADASLAGLTSVRADRDASRGDVLVVRAGIICETLSAARSKMNAMTAPAPTPLPLEPATAYPTETSSTSSKTTSGIVTPPVVSSTDFDIAFITPRTMLHARERADYTGGRSGRAPEAEARLGRLTDFGSWTEYFADVPTVLIVRVTPKLTESFWMRVAREAARTQGAALPPFKDFKTNFLRLRAVCGSSEVTPIHPFVLEHTFGEKRVVREGLYVFAADALGPQCGTVTLTISSEQAPEKGVPITIDPKLIAEIAQDFGRG